MIIATQLTFFPEQDDLCVLRIELDDLKESHGKVRRGVFKRLKELTDEIELLKEKLKVE